MSVQLFGGGGTPSQVWVGVPYPRSGWGGTLSQVWVGGGTLSQVWVGGTPSQVWTGRYPEGTPQVRSGWWGVPWGIPPPWLDGVHPHHVLMGPPPPHHDLIGYPHHDWTGYPPPPIRQSSIASTCYAASGMPLAFMQEDFLVTLCVTNDSHVCFRVFHKLFAIQGCQQCQLRFRFAIKI